MSAVTSVNLAVKLTVLGSIEDVAMESMCCGTVCQGSELCLLFGMLHDIKAL